MKQHLGTVPISAVWIIRQTGSGGEVEVAGEASEPGIYLPYISPTLLQMIVRLKDSITCTDLQLEAYNCAAAISRL